MAKQWALQSVRKLQARLVATQDPELLQKSLKMLSALPVAADILEETGVHRAVKRLCQHQLVGPLARDLADCWERLVSLEQALQECESHQGYVEKCLSRMHPVDYLQEEVESDWNTVLKRPPDSPNKGQKLNPKLAKHRKVSTEARPAAPQLLFPGEQVHSSAPPAQQWGSCLQIHQEALSSSLKEEEVVFPGRRIHARMPVFAGSKRLSHLPKTTLNARDMQHLTKSINNLWGRGTGPCSVLETRPEKCTPDELCHPKKHHQAAVGGTDELWKGRCLKDHKGEKPQEQESWREMYQRLQDAREQRLQGLTQTIQSAQAHKHQGRRTKMIVFSSVGKSPRQVPGRQENVRIPGAAPHTTGNSQIPSSSYSNPPGSRHTGAAPNSARPPLVPLLNTKKPTAKKMGPLMAKTLKDYKKILSRR